MNNKFGIFIIVLAGAILVWGLYSMVLLIIIKNKGTQIIATIRKVDTECDRYNGIEVIFSGRIYSVTISRANCQDRVYKVGQKVALIKYKNYDQLVWPEAKFEWLPFLFLGLLTLGYYTNKGKFGKRKKRPSNMASPKQQL